MTPFQELLKQSQQIIEEARRIREEGELRRAQKIREAQAGLTTEVERSRLLREGRSLKWRSPASSEARRVAMSDGENCPQLTGSSAGNQP